MKISRIELIKNRRPMPLPEPWRPAWNEPDTDDLHSVGFSFFKIHTDEGIVGIGPCGLGPCTEDSLRAAEKLLIGEDPAFVERFFDNYMRGHGAVLGTESYGGLEIALWDIIGKAAGTPVFKLLGAYTDRIMAYAATAQLHAPEESAKRAVAFKKRGIKAMKLRLHRPDPEDDLEVVRSVREAVGEEMKILVDANQNHTSPNYDNWSRRTSMRMAKELDELGVFWLEEPLPRTDLEGLSQMSEAVEMYIAGGEHCTNIYELRDALYAGAYDIVQPDVVIGHVGITGIRKLSVMADSVGRLIAPHVCTNGNSGLHLAATLQALGTVSNCPLIEYGFDPPALTHETLQAILIDPIMIDEQGYVEIPQKPGIGIELNEELIAEYI